MEREIKVNGEMSAIAACIKIKKARVQQSENWLHIKDFENYLNDKNQEFEKYKLGNYSSALKKVCPISYFNMYQNFIEEFEKNEKII